MNLRPTPRQRRSVTALLLLSVALAGGCKELPGTPGASGPSGDTGMGSTGPSAPTTGAPGSPSATPGAPGTSATPGAPGTSATPPTGTNPPTSVGGWIAVDPAAQAAATAAFFARKPKPVTGNPVKVPEFNVGCTTSHHNSDDPIVLPNLAGASHNHTFWGNKSTNANSTAESLRAATATTCNSPQDHSAYWVPTMLQNGKVVDPDEITVYYGSRLKDPSKTQPFPFGLRMIVGDAKNQVDTPDKQGNHFWCAGIGGEVGRSADGTFPVCAKTAHIVRQITFPDCWDGKHLDSPDHKAHMANGDHTGACPKSHPVPVPSVSFVISYPLSANTDGITLASGTSFSMHADFFNAWEDDALAARVRNCLDQGVKCNSAGNF
ncbi:DUF1996 domain-containing protein [Micromonospora sp. NBC_01796]|uniref:DUF1996 domain-containing protein n=1 Tax=Micromonospora sp. NBC_01796 TaxID=2975987 RepID=UPI002DDA2277|nr:DUF1996 domain-containing protein [Micromonospora sp. NBC_01796]WSA88843.1 DUF1996 domain-containing protein [Micromonospora sp. NBC_01796]